MQQTRWKMYLIIILTVVSGITGCQRASDETKEVRREVSLHHYFSFPGPFAGTMHAIASDFNRTNSSHILRPIPIDHESFKASILDDLRLEKTADIYTYWAGARMQSIVKQLEPIDDVLPSATMEKLFGSSIVKSACTYNGRVYLVPVTQHFVGFFYNKKIFADNGLAPPKTWNEFLLLGKKLKARGVTPIALGSKAKWPAQFWFDYLLLRTAPMEYRQKLMTGRGAYTDPEVTRVFSLWHDLVKNGMFNTHPNELEFDSGAGLMVQNGEAAMTLMGTWMMGYFSSLKVNWQEDSDYGFFPFPTIDPQIPPVAVGPIDGLVIPANAKNPEGAKAVLRHFTDSHAQETLSRSTGAMAPSLQVADGSYSPLKKAIRAEIAKTRFWAFNYDLATPPGRAEIGLNLFAEFMDQPDQYMELLGKAEARMKQLALPEASSSR